VPGPIPTVDGLLAATALVHDHVLVTRSIRDVKAPADSMSPRGAILNVPCR